MTVRRGRAAAKAPARRTPRAAGKVPAPRPESFLRTPWLWEAGVPITADTATQVSAVYGCCRLIVDSLAPAPITVTEIKQAGVREARPDDAVAYTLNYGAPVVRAPDAPPAQAIEEALFWSALLTGNGYAEIQRDNANKLFALWPIEPERVTPRRDGTGFYYEIAQPEGGKGRIEAANMFHLRGPSLFGWVGDSTVYRAAKAIGIGQAAQVYSAAYFANGTIIAGVLTSDKVITQGQADDAKRKWKESHGGGPSSAHDIAVMGQGLKYDPINHNAQEAQLVEARRFQVHEIARFFGVPTTLLADNEAWTNLSELYLGFYRNALRPWAERFDAEATRKLFPERQPWREVAHDLTHLTLGSFKDQVAACAQAVNDGLWTRNEARAVFGKNSVEGGDVLVVASAVKSLEDALEPPKPPPATALPGSAEDDDGERSDETAKRADGESMRMAREAVVVMLAHEFERHSRKVARAAAKKRPAEDEVAKLRAGCVADCGPALAYGKSVGIDLGAANLDAGIEAVERGEIPRDTAERILEGTG